VRTRYLTAGDGPPVLLVHGFGFTADGWRSTIAGLAGEFRLVAPDCLGQGGTDAIDLDGKPPHGPIVEHLLAFCDAVDVDRTAVVGSSFGALIAVLLCLQAPSRVTSLVVVGSGSLAMDDAQLVAALARTKRAGVDYFADPTLERTRARFATFFRDPAVIPPWVTRPFFDSVQRPSVRTFYLDAVDGMADIEAARPYRVVDRLHELRIPVLVTWGRFDPMGTPDDATRIAAKFAGAELVLFDRSAHVPYIEEPDAFTAAVGSFLHRAVPDA
jgi:pimeloyl-ACP methyl ester carboxylesterase